MVTIKTYLSVGNDYVEDNEIGGINGVEYSKDGETYRCMRVNFSSFDDANRSAVGTFRKEIKGANKWGYDSTFSKAVNDFSGGISMLPDTMGQRFEMNDCYELDENGEKIPVNKPWKWQLKQGIITEAQFFIDTMITGRMEIPVTMKAFDIPAILKHEGLTL